jgi:hypothetical protein
MPVAPAAQGPAQAAAQQAAQAAAQQQGGSTSVGPHQTVFAGAPATKLLTAVTLLSYLVIHSQNAHDLLQLDSSKLLDSNSNSGYRYWTSKLTFHSTGELITGGLLLLFLSRKMEREMGSRKFSVFYLLVTVCAMAMELIMVHTDMLLIFSTSSNNKWQYAGPYAVLGALFWLFHKYTPRLHPRFFGVAGFYFSEKSFYYLWFGQVATATKWHTVTAVAIGVLVGAIYTNAAPVAWLKVLDVPDVVASLCSKFGERVLLQGPPRMMVPSGGGNGNPGALRQRPAGAAPAHPIFGHAPPPLQQGQQQHPGAQQMPPPAQQQRDFPPTPPPDEASIDQLVLMGFPRDKVIEALQNSHNDVNRAADRLLTQL